MSEKIVTPGATAATVTLTGEEIMIKFSPGAPFFWVKNTGNSELYAANKSGISPGTDGVYPVAEGDVQLVPAGNDSEVIYLSGTGTAFVIASPIAACPFKSKAKGGGSEIMLTFCLFGMEIISDVLIGEIYQEV